MGQSEVYDFLRQRLLKGDDTYFTIKDIAVALKLDDVDDRNGCLKRATRQLYAYGYLEIRDIRQLPFSYRLKESCLSSKQAVSPLSKGLTAEGYKRLT